MKTIVVATRIDPTLLAKARDGLIKRGISPNNLQTKSAIIRLSVFLAITLNDDQESAPSHKSLQITSN